jgi:phage terminase large subunit
MGDTVEVVIPYSPRPLQLAIHEALDAHRFGVVVCHRRFGKTVMAINHLIRAALTCEKERGRFAYVGPTYRQAKAIAWDYLKHYSRPVPGSDFNESELRVDFPNGSQVRLYGADNPDALRGIYLDGVVPDEFGLMQGKVWSEVLRPALTDRKGWAVFIGTPNGKNAFWELRDFAAADPAWYLAEYKASETEILPADELDLARSTMSAGRLRAGV